MHFVAPAVILVLLIFLSSVGEAPFLNTERGSPNSQVFRSIRLQHILADPVSIGVLEKDNIIPQGKGYGNDDGVYESFSTSRVVDATL